MAFFESQRLLSSIDETQNRFRPFDHSQERGNRRESCAGARELIPTQGVPVAACMSTRQPLKRLIR